MMRGPASSYEGGVAVIVRAFRSVDKFPAERIVRNDGLANATSLESVPKKYLAIIR